MMRKVLLAAAAVGVLAGAGVAVAQPQGGPPQDGPHRGGRPDFARSFDANSDGTVTRAEFDAARAQMFTRLDANHDGVLADDELRGPRGGRDHDGPPPPGPDAPPPPDGAHGDHDGHRGPPDPDANHDGVITRDEFLAGPIAMFDRLDANHDGRLTDAEKPDRTHFRMGRHHRGGFGFGLRGADANHDGRVTRAEFDAEGAALFTRMDANHDGQLTQADRDARHGERGADRDH